MGALAVDLMSVGLASEQAIRLGYQAVAVAAAGTAQGTATPIQATSGLNLVATVTTGASAQGVILPSNAEIGQEVVISPAAATPLITVYPSTGQSIDLLSANAGIAFTTANKNAVFRKVGATKWLSFISGAA